MSEWGDLPYPARMTEAEAVDYVRELYRLEAEPGCQKSVVTFGPATAFLTIGALQLATRHPDIADSSKYMIRHVIDQLAAMFAGTPGAELLDLGNAPALDIPAACRYPFGSHAPECPPGGHAGFAPEPVCAACGRPFADDDGVIAISDGGSGVIPIHVDCAGAGNG